MAALLVPARPTIGNLRRPRILPAQHLPECPSTELTGRRVRALRVRRCGSKWQTHLFLPVLMVILMAAWGVALPEPQAAVVRMRTMQTTRIPAAAAARMVDRVASAATHGIPI